MSVNLLPLVMAVYTSELCLALPVLPWHSIVAARSTSSASVRLRFLLSRRSVAAFPKTWAKSWTSSRSPVDFRFHDICSDCFPCVTRPRFELGLSSRAPQVSAKRVRLSCSLKSRVLSSMHHDVLNVGLSTPHGVLDGSAPNSPRVVWQLHQCSRSNNVTLSGARLAIEWSPMRNLLPWHSMATSTITSSLVQSSTRSSARTLIVQLE